VATSLDGYIAGPNGEYDWIVMPRDAQAFFKAFHSQFDTAVVGRRSFEISGPLPGLRTFVFSRTLPSGPSRGATVLGADALERLAALKAEEGKDIWLYGGGALFGALASAGLVDTAELCIVPVLLGGGIPVISGIARPVGLRTVSSERTPEGLVFVNYEVLPPPAPTW
jgi:dihydrofolate reductase